MVLDGVAARGRELCGIGCRSTGVMTSDRRARRDIAFQRAVTKPIHGPFKRAALRRHMAAVHSENQTRARLIFGASP